MHSYVVKDAKVYELSFHSEPLKVPETLTFGENIIKPFRFIQDEMSRDEFRTLSDWKRFQRQYSNLKLLLNSLQKPAIISS
jgi:hypothetical protein